MTTTFMRSTTDDLFAEGNYYFGCYNWETNQLYTTYQTDPIAKFYVEIFPICYLTSPRCGPWGRYVVKTGSLEVSANRPEESVQQSLSFNLQPAANSPPGTPSLPIARYLTQQPPRNLPTVEIPSLALPVPQLPLLLPQYLPLSLPSPSPTFRTPSLTPPVSQLSPPIPHQLPQFLPSPPPMFQMPSIPLMASPLPMTQYKTQEAMMLKWRPTVFGADITNTVGASGSPKTAPQKGSGRSQKRRRTEAAPSEVASPSTDGTSTPVEESGSGPAWPWTQRIICNVRESDCRFSAAGTDEMRDHLSSEHNIWKGKGTRLTVEGVKVPKERCPWGECTSVLESSSLRKHLQANHIGAKKLWYVCGYCDKALSLAAKPQHEQGRCKGRQS